MGPRKQRVGVGGNCLSLALVSQSRASSRPFENLTWALERGPPREGAQAPRADWSRHCQFSGKACGLGARPAAGGPSSSKTEATELCWGLSFELWGPLWLQLSSRTATPDGTASSALPVILMERWGSQSRFLSGPRLLPPAFLQMRHLTAPGHLVILTPLLTATT